MKEAILKFKEWWGSLATRERRILTIGGALLSIFILYAGIWQPYQNKVIVMREKIGQDEKLLQWMKITDQAISKHDSQTPKKTGTASPVAMLGIIQKRIDKEGLANSLKQLKQATIDTIEIHFEKVNFDKLMRLLIAISQEENVIVNQFTVNAKTEDGLVNADIILGLR